MLGHLIESMPRRRGFRGLPGPSVSLGIHAMLLLGAVLATRHSGFEITNTVATPVAVTYHPTTAHPAQPEAPDEPVFGRVDVPAVPVTMPTTLPPIDSTLVIDTTTIS